jgi:DMSO/TMAO reductase YedYZ molybdopterin-dependent catalytic subunit
MSHMLSRRKLITTGLATAAGVSGLGVAAIFAKRYGLVPPDHGGIFGVGETMTYAAQRILMSRHSLAREFNRSEISKVAPINGNPPENETYERLQAGGFEDWRLIVDGLVARPTSFSLRELMRFPSRTQITHQACEEGWSFIAEWTGVQLSTVLNFVGVRPEANYVAYFSFDEAWWDNLDMPDALHPQTFLTYGMNGQELPISHGAPVRMRVARQLGFKSVKHLRQITVTNTLKNIRDGLGSAAPTIGYTWHGGI